MRTFWIIIVVALWLLLGYFMCSASKECCNVDGATNAKNINEAPAALNGIVKETGPLLFNWQSSDPIIDDAWDKTKSDILAQLDDDEKLKIIGRYFSDEENTSQYDNMGLARAHDIKEKLFTELSDDRIEYSSRVSALRDGTKNNPFKSVDFEYAIFKETVKEIGGKAIVLFPFNSTNRIKDADVEQYLNNLVDRLKSTKERIKVTGHTCSDGNATANRTLGQWRADRVRDFLTARGIAANRISATSAGQSAPRVPNSNEANKKQNRRAEIEIIQ